MKLDGEILCSLAKRFGDSFYILDVKRLTENYKRLENAFTGLYSNTHIAYSYKTNYIPAVCKVIDRLGGYAEVVSEMEYALAKKIGVVPDKTILNGPVKSILPVEALLLNGGYVNIDTEGELEMLEALIHSHPEAVFHVGIRCNFDVSDGMISRFGIDTESSEFDRVLDYISAHKRLRLAGLHCHFAARNLKTWRNKVSGMLDIINRRNLRDIAYVDFGGGLYGEMSDSLKAQFDTEIPSFEDYAEVVARPFAEQFRENNHQPKLFIEPGTAVVSDAMQFVSRVKSIKAVRGKSIATLYGSLHNISPTLSKKNLPICVYPFKAEMRKNYTNMDFGGYTCIESDYLYKGYTGELGVGDFVVFHNVGSYSVVLKPPFILPNFPVISVCDDTEEIEVVKRAEHFEDIFNTYSFN